MKEKLKFGIVGLGMVAQRDVLPRFPFEENLQLIAVCDVIEGRAQSVIWTDM